jgi:hypothetical protein
MSAQEGPLTIDADALLGMRSVEAAVNALATRNQHHLATMGPEEQQEAANTWRQIAVDVLSAARDALAGQEAQAQQGAGRAVIVMEDQGGDEVGVHVTFMPQLEEQADGSIIGTPAQLAAMSLLEAMTAEQPEDDHGHGHSHEHGHGHEH